MIADSDKEKEPVVAEGSGDAAYCFALPEDSSILEAEEMLKQCRQAADSGQMVEVDLGSVKQITTPALQLMLSLEKSLERQGKTMRLKQVPEGVEDVFQTLGLAQKLDAIREI